MSKRSPLENETIRNTKAAVIMWGGIQAGTLVSYLTVNGNGIATIDCSAGPFELKEPVNGGAFGGGTDMHGAAIANACRNATEALAHESGDSVRRRLAKVRGDLQAWVKAFEREGYKLLWALG